MTDPDRRTDDDLSDLAPLLARRGLIAGAGAAALIAGSLAATRPAEAKPTPPGVSAGAQINLSPVTSTIGSAPISGYTYRHVSWLDFQPESGPATRSYGGQGAYSSGTSPYMWATVEIPAGALVRDLEWYVYNNSGLAVSGLGRLWAAGTGTLFKTLADTSISSTGSVVSRRSVVSSSNYGPHPLGTKIALGLNTGGANTVQVNGARVGFTQGSGTVGMLPTPIRAYDSRVTGGKLPAGTVRTITLPSTLIRPGTSAVIVNVAATQAEANGYLKVYPGNAAAPEASALNYAVSRTIANAIIVGVSSSRQIKIFSSSKTHFILDVSGTIG